MSFQERRVGSDGRERRARPSSIGRWLRAALALALPCALVGASPAAQPSLPREKAIYGHVSHLGWVVRDLDAVRAHWKAIGVTDIEDGGVHELPDVVYRGKPVTLRMRTASAHLGNARVHWIQPIGEGTAYSDFLASHGDGVHHVGYRVPTVASFERELAHFKQAGVDVVQGGTWKAAAGTGRFAYLDTAPQGGGLTIELEMDPDAPKAPPRASTNAEPFNKVTQYAVVVRDVKQVSAFYERIGLGALPVERNVSLDRVYRGKPGVFEMFLGWGRGGDIVFEWIQPSVGPSVYDEYLEQRGEGFHHLGFNVTDMDAAVSQLRARGLDVTMSGGWDVNGHVGRFAYLDAEKRGGVAIELLWNKP
jgi:catechol 2,3-dioxygenase-like lactoylglutathione lyase family enzyme